MYVDRVYLYLLLLLNTIYNIIHSIIVLNSSPRYLLPTYWYYFIIHRSFRYWVVAARWGLSFACARN